MIEVFPGTFADAIASSSIYEGDTLLLHGGTYTAGDGLGYFDVRLNGSAAKPIVIRNYPGEHVRINGSIYITNGSYIHLRGLEIGPTPTTRDFTDRTGFDLNYGAAVRFFRPGCKAINCVLHDGSEGLEVMGASPAEIYGCLVYNNGWKYGADQQTGYGCYTHNDPAQRIDIRHNLIMQNMGGYALHLNSYSNKITNYHMTENGLLGGTVFSSATLISDCFFDKNHVYNNAIRTGQSGFRSANISSSLTDNRIFSWGIGTAFADGDMQGLTVTGNKIGSEAYINEMYGNLFANGTWDNNIYYTLANATTPFFMHENGGPNSFASWKNLTGYDANSTLASGTPAVNEVFVHPNAYRDADDERMGIVVIWNWQGLNSVSVDLSSLSLTNGTYRWRQAQDPYGDTATFSYSGAPVSFLMTGHTVAIPTATGAALDSTSFPTFGAFVIEI